jgi:hypothetical protein
VARVSDVLLAPDELLIPDAVPALDALLRAPREPPVPDVAEDGLPRARLVPDALLRVRRALQDAAPHALRELLALAVLVRGLALPVHAAPRLPGLAFLLALPRLWLQAQGGQVLRQALLAQGVLRLPGAQTLVALAAEPWLAPAGLPACPLRRPESAWPTPGAVPWPEPPVSGPLRGGPGPGRRD